MKKLFLILLAPFIIFGQVQTGSLKGKTFDAETNEILIGANVILVGTNIGAVSDKNGSYEIQNIPFGKYSVKCSYIGYPPHTDTIELNINNPEIVRDFYLEFVKIPLVMPDSIKEYHNYFSSLCSDKILTIHIDSISQDYNFLYMTFTNKTNYPIYLIEDLLCFNTITVYLEKENGDIINSNIVNMGCDVIGVNYLPQKNNFIKLNPFESMELSPIRINEYSLDNYPLASGKYFISVKYEIKNYEYLPGFYQRKDLDYYSIYKDEMETLNQATRGIYFSKNRLNIIK